MIKSFEDVTTRLSEFEKAKLLPLVVEILETRRGEEKALTNRKLRDYLELAYSMKPNAVTVRKVINYIRCNNMIPCLVATSKGYYVTDSKEEMERYIDSLKNRITSIEVVINSLKKQLKKYY